MNDKAKEVAYWDCDDNEERLRHESMDEAIEAHLDGEDIIEGEINVYGFARAEVNLVKFQKAILEFCYDYLSEDYDCENGHEQCDTIQGAALTFARTYLDNYTVYRCDLVKTETVNVKNWIQKNRPDWIKS